MKCKNCSFENPNGAKFCQNCGQPLERKCPNCNTINAAGARFCVNCGHNLAGEITQPPNQDPRLSRLAANTPTPLAEKMRAASHIAGERRLVTVLFADVVGSTSLAEQIDPEDWTAIMNRAFDLLVPIIYRYEGTIARLMGDALLAFFGAPVAHEDDPLRAVHAGLDMISVTREYADEVRTQFGLDFAIRVGLNTGPVVVGEVGSDLVYEYTAMGDAVNLASRMQSAARPMTILIAENTYRFIAPVCNCRDLGEIKVKGKADTVRVYEVDGFKEKPDRLRGISGLESSMVGRDKELETLVALCDVVRAGLGRCAVIIGEAGLGKSRLLVEWNARIVEKARAMENNPDTRNMVWAEGHCLSYGQGLPYHLLTDLLSSLLELSDHAEAAQSYSRLVDLTEDLFGDEANEVYPYLGHLLSLPLEGEALERVRLLDPKGLQTQYLQALEKLLRTMSSRQPLILVCEDLHWADPSSTDLLVKLLPISIDSPILFCFLTRPDRDVPGWKLILAARETLGAGLTEIHLQALSETDTRQLISNLLEIEALPESIRKVILRKAEGNPFFVEEVIRMLIDQGVVVQNQSGWVAMKEIEIVDIPDNLQSLLLARIDRLPEDVKHTLRVASVIGRQFSVSVLEQVLERYSQT